MNKLTMLLGLAGRLQSARRQMPKARTVGVGTVRATAADERQVFVEVMAVSGETFIGKLVCGGDDHELSMLRPGW